MGNDDKDNIIIKLYGADWCGDCFRAKKVFERFALDYDYIDIEKDEKDLKYVREVNPNGYESIPVIVFPDGGILIEPDTNILIRRLKDLKLIKD